MTLNPPTPRHARPASTIVAAEEVDDTQRTPTLAEGVRLEPGGFSAGCSGMTATPRACDQRSCGAGLLLWGANDGCQRPLGQVPLSAMVASASAPSAWRRRCRSETLSRPAARPEGWPPTRPTGSKTMAIVAAVATSDEQSEHSGSGSDNSHRHHDLPLQAAT